MPVARLLHHQSFEQVYFQKANRPQIDDRMGSRYSQTVLPMARARQAVVFRCEAQRVGVLVTVFSLIILYAIWIKKRLYSPKESANQIVHHRRVLAIYP